MNNIALARIEEFATAVEKSAKRAIVSKRVSGAWELQEKKPQFTAKVEYAKGKTEFKAEAPVMLGGWGNNPDPIQYFLFGVASCFAATVAVNASREGIKLTKLEVTAETQMNMRKYLGLSKDRITENIKLNVVARGPSQQVLKKLLKVSQERCPGVEWVTSKIPLEVKLKS